ncbi:hypothetical protein Tco_0587872 [Tanacetum coccineum]
MSKLLYTRFTKLIIDYLLSLNKSIPRRSDSKLHSSHDYHPITKLLNTTNSDYKFGMEVPDAMISDAIKKKAGYKYHMAKKVESEKAKIIDKPKEQHVSLIKSRRGKGFMCYGDQVANVTNKLKKDVVLRKTRSITIAEKTVVGKPEGSTNETDDAEESYMDLSHDNPHGADDDTRSLRRNRSPVVMVQDDTPAMQPMDKADTLIQKHSKPKWFPKKSELAKRRMTLFDLFFKPDIDNDKNHILGPSTVSIAKKFKELI